MSGILFFSCELLNSFKLIFMKLEWIWKISGKNLSQKKQKCDAIWENPSDVAKWHFEKWLEIVRKLVYNSIELHLIITLDVDVVETNLNSSGKSSLVAINWDQKLNFASCDIRRVFTDRITNMEGSFTLPLQISCTPYCYCTRQFLFNFSYVYDKASYS